VSLTPWGPLALYPFTLFTTWIHECGHALAVVLVGGSVSSVTIEPDTSGLTRSLVPTSRLSRGIIASAGYLTASVVGCFLLTAARVERRAKPILWGIGVFMLVTLVLWVRNLFGALVVIGWAVALLTIAHRRTSRGLAAFVLGVLGIQVALNAVFNIRVLFLVDGPSDAQAMAALFVAPAWFWASLWMAMSVAMLFSTLRATRGR
jgi:hypothetical protein